ncbi:MAG: hypothetical protein HUJ91_07275, partial [Bacteroidales bacterium]|nr:hypothetical protein [Bacteroidales bacterium]
MNPIYDDIRPYNDAEVVAAAERLAQSPLLAKASAALFPDKEQGWLQNILRKVRSVNEFQVNVTSKVMERVI